MDRIVVFLYVIWYHMYQHVGPPENQKNVSSRVEKASIEDVNNEMNN